MKFIFVVLQLLLISFSQAALALDIKLSQQHVNSIVNLNFPVVQHYQGIDIKLLNGNLSFYQAEQKIEFKTRILTENKTNKLIADASFMGTLAFDKKLNALQIINPELHDFKVIENSIPKEQLPLDMVKNVVGKQLPIILLVDFNKLEILPVKPSGIKIVSDGLLIQL